jgi:hypothetical protein
LALSAKGEMRGVWRTREEIEEHLEARDALVASLASGAE